MCLIFAVLIRVFPDIKNEPIIHEFDPQFNVRVSEYIEENGLRSFFTWYDNNSWYPQGRFIGETCYPGLMIASVFIKKILNFLHINIPLNSVMQYIGIASSLIQIIVAYFFGKLLKNQELGIITSIVSTFSSGLIVRTCSGSFDYECVAITVLFAILYLYIKSISERESFLPLFASIFLYWFLSWTWGGYVFISTILSVFAVACVITKNFDAKHYISFSTFFVFGTLFSASLPFTKEKVFTKAENAIFTLTFAFVQIYSLCSFLSKLLSAKSMRTIYTVLSLLIPFSIYILLSFNLIPLSLTGRLRLFLATDSSAVESTVVENQPATWANFLVNCGPIIFVFPLAFCLILKEIDQVKFLFIAIVSIATLYLSSRMVRIMLIFVPIQAIVTSYGISCILDPFFKKKAAKGEKIGITLIFSALFMIQMLTTVNQMATEMSDNYINFEIETEKGKEISDDHREAFQWIRENTDPSSKIIAQWDLGYQLQQFGKRATFIDGNTNNFTHIARIGLAFLSNEKEAWEICKSLGADYVVVSFGGSSGYDLDEVMKMPAVIDTVTKYYNNVTLSSYMSDDQIFIVSDPIKDKTYNSMFFKLSYNKFRRYRMSKSSKEGFDSLRGFVISHTNFQLQYFNEAYTSKHWMIRVYKVI